jgi:hypothetical protein
MKRILIVILTGVLAGILPSCSSNDPHPDDAFDVSVTVPHYTRSHPSILFDHAHKNHHRIDGSYHPWATLLSNDGCVVTGTDAPIDSLLLAHTDVYVTATAMGYKDPGEIPPYTDAEIAYAERWVHNGGSMLIITEHYPFGLAMQPLLNTFGVSVHNGYTEDTTMTDPSVADALLFESSRGHVNTNHPVMDNIERIVTFTGASVKGDSSWSPLLIFSGNAQNYNVDIKVERDGGDTKVSVMYADHYSGAGYVQGMCKEYGKGRIVVLAESALLTAQIDRNGNAFGMNIPGRDNKQFALNIIRWLAQPRQQ